MKDRPPDPQPAPTDPWSLLWRDARLDACAAAEDALLEPIETAWHDHFAQLADGARLLDLATGNGALAWRAARTAQSLGKRIEVHGVDRAAIDPHRAVGHVGDGFERIRFHPGTALEQLPFDAASFDAACSQFGLEYSDTASSVPELARVLRPGASLRLLAHSRDSVIAARNRTQRAELARLLDGPVFAALGRDIDAVADEPWAAGRPLSDRLQAAIAALSEALARMHPGADRRASLSADAIAAVQRLVADSVREPATRLRAAADELTHRLRAQVTRFTDMERASLTDADLRRLERRLAATGFEQIRRWNALAEGGGAKLGVWLTAAKRG